MTFPNFFFKTGPDHCVTVKLQRHDSPWVTTWFDLLLPKEKKVKLKANAFKSKIKEKRKLSSHLSPGVNVAINIKYGYNGEVYFIQQGCHVGVLPVLGNNLKSGLALNITLLTVAWHVYERVWHFLDFAFELAILSASWSKDIMIFDVSRLLTWKQKKTFLTVKLPRSDF